MNLIWWNSNVMLKQKHNRNCIQMSTLESKEVFGWPCRGIFISFNPYHRLLVTSPKGEIKFLMKNVLHLNDNLCCVCICFWNGLDSVWKHGHSRVKTTIVNVTCSQICPLAPLHSLSNMEIFLAFHPYFPIREKWSLFNFNF